MTKEGAETLSDVVALIPASIKKLIYRGKPVSPEIFVRLQAKPNRYEPGKGSRDGISWQDIELALQDVDKKTDIAGQKGRRQES